MVANLLFVCTGNVCRSPMAAAIAGAQGDSQLHIDSAGVAAMVGHPPPDPVIALMKDRGIDVTRHRGKQLSGEFASGFDLVLVMEDFQRRVIEKNWSYLRGRVQRLGEWRDEDVHDPYRQSDEAYLRCLEMIETCLADWKEHLLR